MFDTRPVGSHPRRQYDARALAALGEQVKPVSTSRTQLLPVPPPLRSLFPDGGMRRGTTIGVAADHCGGGATLALALMAAASSTGSWCLIVGFPDLGGMATQELQIDLARLAIVPWPGVQWGAAVAAAIEGVDIVLLRPPPRVRRDVVRRLLARLRDRRAVLIVLTDHTSWPECCDLELKVDTARWVAVGRDEDCLRERLATVTACGRGSANRPLRQQLWLPDAAYAVATA